MNANLMQRPPAFSNTPIDSKLFRDTMSLMPSAVHIVTTDGVAGKSGLTASAVTSVSDQPPTILVCVHRTSRTLAMIKTNQVFCVNVLSMADQALADIFAGRKGLVGEERFEQGLWSQLVSGSPALETAVAVFDCRLTELRPVATHDIIMGEVVAVRQAPQASPLLYHGRTYRV